MTKIVRNSLRIDVLVDTQGPDANENGHGTVRNGLVVVVLHAVAYVLEKDILLISRNKY